MAKEKGAKKGFLDFFKRPAKSSCCCDIKIVEIGNDEKQNANNQCCTGLKLDADSIKK